MSEIGIIVNVRVGDDIIRLEMDAEAEDKLQDIIDYAIEEFHNKTGKDSEGEFNCLLDGCNIEKEDRGKTIEHLELDDGDTLDIEKKAAHDGAKVGKMVILNGTDDEWIMTVYPNIAGQFDEEEKEIEGPSISLPVVGSISLGSYKYKRGKVELKEPEDGNEQHWVKIRGHEIDTLQYVCPTIEAASAKVVSTLNGKAQDQRIVMSGDGILLTNRGVKAAHIKRNFFTGRLRPTSWKAMDQDRNFDPHQGLASGQTCSLCGVKQH